MLLISFVTGNILYSMKHLLSWSVRSQYPFCTLLSLTLPAVFQGSQDPDEDSPEDPEEMVEGRVEEDPEEMI